ncbi:unnamed protein product [Angiostrongylus costaricensis]|uniref:Ion_trans domain-containing protein n=1 Tax=Angiostrongylus costaricensis TaxID=334426 RepID=A0A0R3PI14_ANGCS|nr:unnamed protein product [Angiostrongylus costaricensis]
MLFGSKEEDFCLNAKMFIVLTLTVQGAIAELVVVNATNREPNESTELSNYTAPSHSSFVQLRHLERVNVPTDNKLTDLCTSATKAKDCNDQYVETILSTVAGLGRHIVTVFGFILFLEKLSSLHLRVLINCQKMVCGPKCMAFMIFMSIWGTIFLSIVGALYYNESVGLFEDMPKGDPKKCHIRDWECRKREIIE